VTLLIRHGTVLSPAWEPVQADVRIEGNRIAEIGPGLEPGPSDDVFEARDRLLVPGLVNAHVHSWELPFKGRYDNLPLDQWSLYAYPPFGYEPLPERLVYLRSLMAAIESLRGGVTTIVDDLPELPSQTIESLGAAVKAYADSGIRASVSGNVTNIPFTRYLPFADELIPEEVRARVEEGPFPGAVEYLDFCREAIAHFHDPEGRIRFVIAPAAPQWCTPDLLTGASELARASDVAFHTHALETFVQAQADDLYFGRSFVRYLDELGCLHDRTALIHCVWVAPDDIELMAASGCSAIHNPISNLKLGAGVAPYRRLLDAGIPVGLGTDGLSTSDSLRLLDVVRTTALLHKVTSPDYAEWPTAVDALRSATTGGARAALIDGEVGSLEPGKRADLLVLDLSTVNFVPTGSIANNLVYCEDGSSLQAVVVDGRQVVADGRVTTVDEQAVIGEFRDELEALLARHAKLEERNRFLEPYLRDIYYRCIDRSARPVQA